MDSEAFWGEPVELYLFATGDSTQYAYTDGEREITLDGVTYVPIPIERGRISSSAGLDKTQMTVTAPYLRKSRKSFGRIRRASR